MACSAADVWRHRAPLKAATRRGNATIDAPAAAPHVNIGSAPVVNMPWRNIAGVLAACALPRFYLDHEHVEAGIEKVGSSGEHTEPSAT